MNPLKTIKYFFNKIIMALTYKKLSELTDMTASNIDTTTKLVVTTGVSKTNNNLKVSDLVVDDLVTSNSYRALSAKMGKKLQDEKAPIANPTFTGTVSGITKSMVGLGNVDNTSDANKPVSTAQANTLAPKVNPVFTGTTTIEDSLVLNDSTISFFGQSSIESPIITGLQTFADNTSAAALAIGTVYKTSTGVLMIKY